MRPAAIPLLLALAACGGDVNSLAAPAPVFAPERFFAGRTEGRGRAKVIFSSPRAIRVRSHGAVRGNGTIVVNQIVEEEGRAQRTRQWRLRHEGGGRYTGALSDAQSPVAGQVRGNALHLRFRAYGLAVEQHIFLQPDGRTALNRMTLRKFGVPVARLDETIRRIG
ncbi:MAG: DUF3833 domain-containing protein [Pseudomonadota bacterium]|nr:DUF3833 domain-containing protein [Pseudomonadota bacterium]